MEEAQDAKFPFSVPQSYGAGAATSHAVQNHPRRAGRQPRVTSHLAEVSVGASGPGPLLMEHGFPPTVPFCPAPSDATNTLPIDDREPVGQAQSRPAWLRCYWVTKEHASHPGVHGQPSNKPEQLL